MSLRTEFVLLASQAGANILELCRRYGMSPATACKWLRRREEEGPSGLQDPGTHPAAHLTPSLTSCARRMSFISTGGARRIKRWPEDRGHGMPAFSTVHSLMARHGLLPGVPATGRSATSGARMRRWRWRCRRRAIDPHRGSTAGAYTS